jgi:hypothetical protein
MTPGLVYLVCLVCLVCLVHLVDLVQRDKLNKPEKRDKPKQPDEPTSPFYRRDGGRSNGAPEAADEKKPGLSRLFGFSGCLS